MRRFVALMLMLAAPVVAQAQHPDFSGRWTYDAAQSGGGPGAPTSATITITQSGNSLKTEQSVTSQMGTQNASLNYALDGSTSKNSLSTQGMSLDLSSVAAWEGSTLVITSTADIQGNALKNVDRFSLDASGKVLTMTTNTEIGGQTITRKQVFNKG